MTPWPIAAIALLIVGTALFLVNDTHRRQLDRALARADGRVPPTVPERRWSYDAASIDALVAALLTQTVPGAGEAGPARPGERALEYYVSPILALDMVFTIAFAAFIICAGIALADSSWGAACPWAWWAGVFVAACGVVYGLADLGEDIMLRRILLAAAGSPDPPPADAAQVALANALTRLKLASICFSGVGLVAFCAMMALSWLWSHS